MNSVIHINHRNQCTLASVALSSGKQQTVDGNVYQLHAETNNTHYGKSYCRHSKILPILCK